MAKFSVERLMVGMLGTNCSILVNDETKEAVVIDPGDDAELIYGKLRAKDAKPVAFLLTHAHYDHTMAIGKLLKVYAKVPVVGAEKERQMFADEALNCPPYGGQPIPFTPDVWVKEGDVLPYAGANLRVLETPGHTAGSVCYYLEEPAVFRENGKEVEDTPILFSGDTLFYRSYGRTDFPTGSEAEMWKSLHRILTELPADVLVIPGHGALTAIGYERKVKGIR